MEPAGTSVNSIGQPVGVDAGVCVTTGEVVVVSVLAGVTVLVDVCEPCAAVLVVVGDAPTGVCVGGIVLVGGTGVLVTGVVVAVNVGMVDTGVAVCVSVEASVLVAVDVGVDIGVMVIVGVGDAGHGLYRSTNASCCPLL